MHRGEGQLLQLLSFILGIAFVLKVHFQVKDAADAGTGLDQRGLKQRDQLQVTNNAVMLY